MAAQGGCGDPAAVVSNEVAEAADEVTCIEPGPRRAPEADT
jgi:hypothetical protein